MHPAHSCCAWVFGPSAVLAHDIGLNAAPFHTVRSRQRKCWLLHYCGGGPPSLPATCRERTVRAGCKAGLHTYKQPYWSSFISSTPTRGPLCRPPCSLSPTVQLVTHGAAFVTHGAAFVTHGAWMPLPRCLAFAPLGCLLAHKPCGLHSPNPVGSQPKSRPKSQPKPRGLPAKIPTQTLWARLHSPCHQPAPATFSILPCPASSEHAALLLPPLWLPLLARRSCGPWCAAASPFLAQASAKTCWRSGSHSSCSSKRTSGHGRRSMTSTSR